MQFIHANLEVRGHTKHTRTQLRASRLQKQNVWFQWVYVYVLVWAKCMVVCAWNAKQILFLCVCTHRCWIKAVCGDWTLHLKSWVIPRTSRAEQKSKAGAGRKKMKKWISTVSTADPLNFSAILILSSRPAWYFCDMVSLPGIGKADHSVIVYTVYRYLQNILYSIHTCKYSIQVCILSYNHINIYKCKYKKWTYKYTLI